MSWGPLQPARIDFHPAQAPGAPDFGDRYPDAANAPGRARGVFLAGNGLPGRWAGQPRFVVLEAGFGLGHNFLATWAAWRQDARRCDRLWYVALDKHPPRRADLARAHGHAPSTLVDHAADLLRQWPPLTPDMHLLDFDGGRVRLLLALGDIADVLPELIASVDAFYLDGFAPARNPAMWDAWRLRQLPRLAAPGATLASWCADGALQRGLSAAGFTVQTVAGPGGQGAMTVARFTPRFANPAPPGRQPQAGVRRVAVIGAGLAGSAVAAALAGRGLQVQVVERQAGPARETSGNAGGLFHGVVHAHDGAHARWLRAAALHTARVLRPLVASGVVDGAVAGLVRGEQQLPQAAMQQLLDKLALPADYLQVADWPGPAGARAAWLYPEGGWVAPPALCAAWLLQPGIALCSGQAVQRLQRGAQGWQVLGDAGQVLAEADAVVVCNAADVPRLLGPGTAWPVQAVRGQTTLLPAHLPHLLHLPAQLPAQLPAHLPAHLPGLPALPRPLADGGYALQLADGRLLCGASSQRDDADPALRVADHRHNLATLQRLTGWAGAMDRVDLASLDGRVGWRLHSDDRLPLLGPVPDHQAAAGGRPADQPRRVPRQPGLYVFSALGSRGITQAALGAEVLASWLTGDPVPLPASLVDALDVARFSSRAVRRAARSAE